MKEGDSAADLASAEMGPPNLGAPDFFGIGVTGFCKNTSGVRPVFEVEASPQKNPTDHETTPTRSTNDHLQDLDLALDLADQLLQPESTKRMTARGALYHPFLYEEHAPDDDYFPHPLGQGVCGMFHFRDSVTEEHCVTGVGVDGSGVKRLSAGEGIPIGRRACEFHGDMVNENGVAYALTNEESDSES